MLREIVEGLSAKGFEKILRDNRVYPENVDKKGEWFKMYFSFMDDADRYETIDKIQDMDILDDWDESELDSKGIIAVTVTK